MSLHSHRRFSEGKYFPRGIPKVEQVCNFYVLYHSRDEKNSNFCCEFWGQNQYLQFLIPGLMTFFKIETYHTKFHST